MSNVRQPDHMAGDLHAQMASGEVGAQRLSALCDQHGLDDIEALADEIIDRSEAATRASIRALARGTYDASAVLDLADGSRIDIVCSRAGRPRRRRDHRRLRGQLARQSVGHQRRQELHPRLHHVRGAQRAQPRYPQQSRQPGADQGRGARGLDRQRRATATGHGPPRGGDVPAQRVARRRWPRSHPTRRWPRDRGPCGRCRSTVPTTTAARSSRRCSRTPVASGRGRPSRASTPARTRPVSPPCRSRSSRPRRRSGSVARRCGRFGRTWPADRWARPDDRVLRSTPPGRGSSTPSPAGSPMHPKGSSAASPGAAGRFSVNGDRRHHPGPDHSATRRRRPARPAGRRRLRGSDQLIALRREFTMTILTAELLASLDASTTDVAKASTLPAEIYTSDEFLRFEYDAAVRSRVVVRGRASRIPNPGDWFTVTIAGEPLIVVRDKEGGINCLSAVCQHRAMQVCDGQGNSHHLQVPVSPLELRPRRTAAGRAGDGAHRGLRQEGLPAAALRVEEWQGFVFVNLDPDAAPLAPTLTSYEPFLANYDLADAVCPGTFTLDGPSVELEGDVRELQRRLPRQSPAPVRAGLLPEQHDRVPRAVGRRQQRHLPHAPATPTSTAASTPRTARSCRSSPV